jgi:putative FmdB family regulatory protein
VPTYQYACTSCGEQTEAVQRFTDDPLTVCPACGGTLRKVFSPVGIVFKGSGFYRTDSRNGSVPSGEKTKANGDGSAADGKDGKDGKKPSSDSGSASTGSKSASEKSSGGTSSSDSSKPAAKKPAGAGSSA